MKLLQTTFMRRHSLSIIIVLCLPLTTPVLGQQIAIGRIDLMPNQPSPYVMREWKHVALGYDSLVFNVNLSGQYLPLTAVYSNTVNYPGQNSFGMQSYVGGSLGTGEAINCIPAVVGASLVGLDKSNQNGANWVQMCQEWFNKANRQNIYLNSPDARTGDDWWYETMPNVFFYQLCSMYPSAGDFPPQFVTVADRWLAAVKAMGGKTAPWILPNINHRAFDLMTMKPNDVDVPEPEAAGAIAWLLYAAFVRTGNPEYRIGAELALESLVAYSTNPSYELQLPYGTYVAARMNAEVGTTYNITKLLNWCFPDGSGTLRQWGVIVGTWGGLDCSGLIGEINSSNDYAFFMNVVEQVGALVPLVRYDDRYARAIGKWVLNAANASRLFYTNYLPDDHQDSQQWAHQYDPNSHIAHEAIRQHNPQNAAISPFATGDAINGGWAPTNLALYGSSHVGILGGIIDTTNVPMILRLDLLKTDYFHNSAYPTYLYFNPFVTDTSVAINVGSGLHDLYNTATKTFLRQGVSGQTTIVLPANSAAVIVIAPAGGTMTYDLDKTLIDGVVVDYRSGRSVGNYPPRIRSLSADSLTVVINTTVFLYCAAVDRDNDTLSYVWSSSGGTITGDGAVVAWTAPASAGAYVVSCSVSDGHGGEVTASDTLQAILRPNAPPVIQRFIAIPRKVNLGASSVIACVASDPNGDSLSYGWSALAGTLSAVGATAQWTAPGSAGNYYVACRVHDPYGGLTVDSIGLEVRDLSITQTGDLVAFYPFNGNANDASGQGHHGTVNSAQLVNDRFGHPNAAYSFNGINSSIVVPNDSGLNFQNSVSVNFWMKVGAFYTAREQYPISHGNWQNRWKFSISPNTNTLRWTLKNTLGQIKDLDTETRLVLDSLYNVTGVYDGSDFEIYLNGQLDAFTTFSGLINTTSYALTIGQDLPGDDQYNFNGMLDDVRIYNYALSLQEIAALFLTSVPANRGGELPATFGLEQNYPNPFNPSTTITFAVPAARMQHHVILRVFDILGREVVTLVNGTLSPGVYTVAWDARSNASGVYLCRLHAENTVLVRKMLLTK